MAWGCLHSMRCLDAVLSSLANSRGGSFFTKELTCEEREWLVLAAFLAPLEGGSFRPSGTPRAEDKVHPRGSHRREGGSEVAGQDARLSRSWSSPGMRWSLIGRDGAELPKFAGSAPVSC